VKRPSGPWRRPRSRRSAPWSRPDTSISLDRIERTWKAWRVVEVDFNLADPMQLIVALQRRD
jgi:hypothetical protein